MPETSQWSQGQPVNTQETPVTIHKNILPYKNINYKNRERRIPNSIVTVYEHLLQMKKFSVHLKGMTFSEVFERVIKKI